MANFENNNVVDQTIDANNQDLNNTTSENQKSETTPSQEGKKDGSTVKSTIIGGVAGIVLGSVSTMLMGATRLPDENTHEANANDNQEHQEEVNIPFATSVNDDMTYNEAFAAARQEVGPGGAFVWHGTVYGTYYGTEWNELSPEQQASFSQNAVSQQPVVEHTQSTASQHNDNHQAETQHSQQSQEQHAQEQGEVVEVEVDGVYENVILDDGSVVTIGTGSIEGHDASFIDVDNNGTFDVMAVDINYYGLMSYI